MAEEDPVIVGWAGVWVTTVVSLAQFLIFYIFFTKQRSKEQAKSSYDLFEPRQNTRRHRSPPPFEANWYQAAWDTTDEETLKCVGLDSYMFLRFLRLGARVTLLGTFWSILLIPLYATGDERGDDTLQFNKWTLARVEANSPRMYATVIVWYSLVAFILREFWTEWRLYAKNRYAFLAHGDVDMPKDYRYAIRVEQVPTKLRSDQALRDYFERLFPGKVLQATAYLQTEDLQKLLDERQQLILQLEAAVAFTKAKPDKPEPMIKVGGTCGGKKVPAIPHLEAEIEKINQQVDERRAEFLGDLKKEEDEREGMKKEGKDSKTETEKDGFEVDYTADDQDKQKATSDESSDSDTKTASTAFVTFSSLRAKQAAVQCELTGDPDSMVVVAAPDPKGILWDNVTVPLPQQLVLQLQAAAFWCLGILFWAIPVSFVTSIANLNSILQAFGLHPADPTVFWYGLVSGLLPVIALAILMAVLYMAITAAATRFVRYKSMPEVDRYAFFWHQLFQFANLWLILIGGSLFNQIDAIIDKPSKFVDVIVTAMPGASIFFINMIQVGSLGAFALELSMLPTYGVTLLMKLIQPEAMRTQRQLDDAKKPPSMIWGQRLPPVVFIFLVVILYSTIVPVMEVFGFVYFAGSYIVWKHQFLHVYAAEFEGGGEATWQALFGFLMACLYMGEVVFIAYMGLKEAPVQGGLGFVPLIVTILVHYSLVRNIIRPLRNLSLEVAASVDIDEGELREEDMSGGKLYGQPTLDAEQDERGPMPYRREAGTKDLEDQKESVNGKDSVDTLGANDDKRFM